MKVRKEICEKKLNEFGKKANFLMHWKGKQWKLYTHMFTLSLFMTTFTFVYFERD